MKVGISLVFLCSLSSLFAQEWPVPFEVELEEQTWTDWPALHSFAHASYDGRWFIMGGRTGGMHGLVPPDPFPLAEANTQIHMLDPLTGAHWERSIFELADSLVAPLRGTNPQFLVRDSMLFYMGGYGKDTLSDNFITFPVLIVANLNGIRKALEDDTPLAPHFTMYRDSLFYLCGGEAEWLGDTAYLFGGHEFTGEYSQIPSINFEQRYPNELRTFRLEQDGPDWLVTDVEISYDSLLFHRRDLTFEPVIFPGGQQGLAAFSGVFRYEQNTPWLSNVYFDGSTWWEDTLTHRFSNYSCPSMGLYDPESSAMYSILFGGISQFWYSEEDSSVYEDLNVPFVNDISVVVQQWDGSTYQYLLPIQFDQLYGSNAAFFPAGETSRFTNGVIDLSAVEERLLAGYIFGGIDPEFPNFTSSVGSNKLYAVYIKPPSPVTGISQAEGGMNIFPNPASDRIILEGIPAEAAQVRWVDVQGKVVAVNDVTEVISTPSGNGLYRVEVYNASEQLLFTRTILVQR